VSTSLEDVGEARRAHQVTEAKRNGRHTDLLRRVCHELLSPTDFSTVLRSVLAHVGEHLGSEIAYLRVTDQEQPNKVIESVRGMAVRELEAVVAWLDRDARAPARRKRPDTTLGRFPIKGPPGIEGVLVLDDRSASGANAYDDHRVILAITGLIADAVRFRRTPIEAHACEEASTRAASGFLPTTTEPDPHATAGAPSAQPPRSLKSLMFGFERKILIEALQQADGNHSHAARALQTTPRILAYRLKRHGLHGLHKMRGDTSR
jgi:hypothetical protein